MTKEEELAFHRERLKLAYEAEKNALECQSTSNAEGEQQAMASLAQIRATIASIRADIAALEGDTGSVTMFWEMNK